MTDTMLRQQAVTGEVLPVLISSDQEVVTEQIEAYIVENKGMIMGCLTSLPAPILMIVRGLVKVVLIPLDFVVTLPLNKISNVLRDFTKSEPACTAVVPPVNGSDCVPTHTV